jgi:hypothetical protein
MVDGSGLGRLKHMAIDPSIKGSQALRETTRKPVGCQEDDQESRRRQYGRRRRPPSRPLRVAMRRFHGPISLSGAMRRFGNAHDAPSFPPRQDRG